MEKLIIRHQFSKNHENQPEIFKKPSKTIPDMTMSIPEMIKRFASGLPLGGGNMPLYSDDPENDILQGREFKSLDLSEQMDLIRSVKHEINDINTRVQNTKKQKEYENVNKTQPSTDESK